MSTISEYNLKEAIDLALKKVNAKKESDICRYLPNENGCYIHHFTFKKLKVNDPQKCFSLIEEFILNIPKPKELAPNPRAPRGSNGKNSQIKLPSDMMNRIIQIAREAKDEKLLSKLIGTRPLNQIKRELIRSIRNNSLDEGLWEAYKDAIQTPHYES